MRIVAVILHGVYRFLQSASGECSLPGRSTAHFAARVRPLR
jgi:hypothetical protein